MRDLCADLRHFDLARRAWKCLKAVSMVAVMCLILASENLQRKQIMKSARIDRGAIIGQMNSHQSPTDLRSSYYPASHVSRQTIEQVLIHDHFSWKQATKKCVETNFNGLLDLTLRFKSMLIN